MSGPALPEGTGVLLMGYGSPANAGDLPGYLTEVLGGRAPSKELVEEYRRRYELIGWSPQLRIISSLRAKLERRLAADGDHPKVFLGTKHWTPHVADVIGEAADAGVRRLIAVPLSPYASPWILAPYQRAIDDGTRGAKRPVEVELRSGWHRRPEWIGYWADAIRRDLAAAPSGTVALLSAHSLPQRHRDAGDPYPEILAETAQRIADAARPPLWEFTYQSAGNTTEPWLGPDVTERMVAWRDRGHPDQLLAPIGFVFEHLEVLYDLDHVVREFAEAHGVRYHRVRMPNDDDQVVEALRRVVLGSPSS
jgi:protoporphyrin/coproporphyrin ferrochelatase